jgi:hypothetical protein
MFRFVWHIPVVVSILLAAHASSQSPAPSSSIAPTASGAPTPSKSATPSPSLAAMSTKEQLIDSLSAADLQAAITLLKNNFTTPDAINETELNRATLEVCSSGYHAV